MRTTNLSNPLKKGLFFIFKAGPKVCLRVPSGAAEAARPEQEPEQHGDAAAQDLQPPVPVPRV
eukprot:4596611-Pyramimonas_sp.AAC.1